MASNRELRDEAQALSEKLGEPGADTSRMNNGQLTELVNDLRRRVDERAAGGSTEPPGDGAARGGLSAGGAVRAAADSAAPEGEASDAPAREPSGSTTPAAAPARTGRVSYEVAPKKAITTARGVLGPGEQVLPKDLVAGEKQLEHLASLGYLLRKTS